jgi:predicted Holliday junction resolvase-like endonuclease
VQMSGVEWIEEKRREETRNAVNELEMVIVGRVGWRGIFCITQPP